MTRNLRKAASAIDNAEFLPMWAGQGVMLTRAMPAAALVESLVAEAQTCSRTASEAHQPYVTVPLARIDLQKARSFTLRHANANVEYSALADIINATSTRIRLAARSIECPPNRKHS